MRLLGIWGCHFKKGQRLKDAFSGNVEKGLVMCTVINEETLLVISGAKMSLQMG